MAHAIAGDAGENRATLLPMLLLYAGPLLFPVSIAGFGWLLVTRAAEAWRTLAIAFIVVVALVFETGGKFYYAAGFIPVLIAAGAPLVDRWLARGHLPRRASSFASTSLASAGLMAILTLPILPPATLAGTPVPNVYTPSAEQVGWPQFVTTVSGVVDRLPATQRSHAVILTANYAEAASLELLGTGLPPVYSAHNSYWSWGPPSADRTTVVLVGQLYSTQYFGDCQAGAVIDNGYGLENQEEGAVVVVCDQLVAPWTDIWPELRHFD